jgi:RNA polymerase sigma factor (sigma-70 family)
MEPLQMSPPLDDLIERLQQGDGAAAEQVFRQYEPYLRMVVRRRLPDRLRPKFDSIDIVQSIWADAVAGFRQGKWHFENVDRLRAFLIRLTHNRFIDRLRQNRQALLGDRVEGQETLNMQANTREATPLEHLQAKELWDRLTAMCPPQHRHLLDLKRQGLSLTQIAAETGLHEGSVRRILTQLEARLHGHRGD